MSIILWTLSILLGSETHKVLEHRPVTIFREESGEGEPTAVGCFGTSKHMWLDQWYSQIPVYSTVSMDEEFHMSDFNTS
jgi:hypothetical protein